MSLEFRSCQLLPGCCTWKAPSVVLLTELLGVHCFQQSLAVLPLRAKPLVVCGRGMTPRTMLTSKAMPAKAPTLCTTGSGSENDTPCAFLTRSGHRPLQNCRYALPTCQLAAPRFLRCLALSRSHAFCAAPELPKQKRATLGAILARPFTSPGCKGADHLPAQPGTKPLRPPASSNATAPELV